MDYSLLFSATARHSIPFDHNHDMWSAGYADAFKRLQAPKRFKDNPSYRAGRKAAATDRRKGLIGSA